MDLRPVLHILGSLSVLLGLLLLIPAGIALFEARAFAGEVPAFAVAVLLSLAAGAALRRLFPLDETRPLCARQGFAAVTFGWLLLTVLGALPFWLSGACETFVDAVFEVMSGFTTTGATVVTDIEGLPPGVMFWRSFSHWLGGMGIVALSIAVLPALGAGGVMLYQAEIPGPSKDRLYPRISATAKTLWYIYAFLTFAETGLLWAHGMTLYDSLCHAFGTMATGGFSTKTLSIGYYGAGIQWTTAAFMFLAGVNFVLHFQLVKGKVNAVLFNRELWFYVFIMGASILVITLVLYFSSADAFSPGRGVLLGGAEGGAAGDWQAGGYKAAGGYYGVSKSLRDAAFQVVSIMTTTGYCTADFDRWPYVCRWLLVLLMFGGACAGSTGGGIKLIRVLIVLKAGLRELKRLAKPSAFFTVKVGGKSVSEEILNKTVGFMVLYFTVFILCTIFISLIGYDVETSFTAVLACISNIGPGLGGVGAAEHYAHFPDVAKIVLSLCMLLGRLEIFAVLILLSPLTWRK